MSSPRFDTTHSISSVNVKARKRVSPHFSDGYIEKRVMWGGDLQYRPRTIIIRKKVFTWIVYA